MKHKSLSKKANAAIGKAITVITAVVLGGAMMVGGAGVIKHTVMPTTTTKVNSMFGMSGDAAGGSGGTGGGSMGDDVAPVTELKRNGIIPEGGVYYKGGYDSGACYGYTGVKGIKQPVFIQNVGMEDWVYTAEPTATYTAGQNFPSTVEDGDVYVEGDYVYGYDYAYSGNEGWKVYVTENKSQYGKIISEINNKQVIDISNLFRDCTLLSVAPVIPSSVTNMDSAFRGCTALTTAPTIPNSVTDMSYTFYNCSSLTGSIEVNANLTDYYYRCFTGTTKHITLIGISNRLSSLAGTSGKKNITSAFCSLKSIPEGGIYYKGGIKCPTCTGSYGVKGIECHLCFNIFDNEPTTTYTARQDFPLIVDIGDIYVKDNQIYACTGPEWVVY